MKMDAQEMQNIYWGDIHNHCNISYGFGSQTNALKRAADHLDFCAVTGYEGLRRGNHFGFAGSTDHHAGYPGSYGNGKMAVLAAWKNRESTWDALLNRRVYAVTGDRICREFYVNDMPMGTILPLAGKRMIRWKVKGCIRLDRISCLRISNRCTSWTDWCFQTETESGGINCGLK